MKLPCVLSFVLLVGSSAAASAQSSPAASGSSGASESADVQWQSLKNKGEPNTLLNTANAASKTQAIAGYIADADALEAFYTKNPTHPAAKEAERRETLALLYARTLGDKSQAARTQALVQHLRKEPAINLEQREQLAAFSDNLDVADRGIQPEADRLLAYEHTSRALQAEFPGSASIYEALNEVAVASPDDRAATLASDILEMPAPANEKARAQILLSRLALKGTSLPDLASAALGTDNPVHRVLGRPIVLYSWSSLAPQSLVAVKSLASQAPVGTAFIGVCLDLGDPAGARARAASQQLPGEQIFDAMGYAGRLAGRAELVVPGLVYVADRKGRLVSVSAQRDPAALLTTLSNL